MEKIKIGDRGLEITRIVFGAWAIGGWMWGGTDVEDSLSALKQAIDLGMTTIDTAPVYGFGLSESLVGKAIEGKRNSVQLLTKFGLKWDSDEGSFYFHSHDSEGREIAIHKFAGKQSILDECDKSLSRLKTDYIDLYQIHWHDPKTPIDESMEALEILLQNGKIREAGVCNYNTEQMKEAVKNLNIASNQVPYSMVERGIEKELLPYCIENKKAVLAYSPLQRGLLTGKIDLDHRFKDDDHRGRNAFFKSQNREKILNFLELVKPIALSKNISLAQLVIRWTMNRPGISSVLVGARNVLQVNENFQAYKTNITQDETNFIQKHLDELVLDLS